jgi:hypothetical protein
MTEVAAAMAGGGVSMEQEAADEGCISLPGAPRGLKSQEPWCPDGWLTGREKTKSKVKLRHTQEVIPCVDLHRNGSLMWRQTV